MPTAKIAPSMLSSDFANLANEAKRMVELGADYLHMGGGQHVYLSHRGSRYSVNCSRALTCLEQPLQLIQQIHAAGMKAGIAVKPKTPVETVLPFCSSVEMILIMTVEPGFGGQSFMPEVLPKVSKIRQEFPDLDIQVDGGLGPDTIEQAAKAGANVIVAGTSVFKAPSPGAVIQLLRDSVNSHN